MKAFGQINADPVNVGGYRAVLYYCKPTSISDDDRKEPTVFMDSDNQQIIDTVKLLGCNTIFFSVSTLPTNQTPNNTNLGISTFTQNGVKYLDKMVDFLDKCANQGIKVFALMLDSAGYINKPSRALAKLDKILFYQIHVRKDATNNSFYSKKAHFHGIVTNIEPWTLAEWQDICASSNLPNSNLLLSNYLNLIYLLRNEIENYSNYSFFNPPVASGYQPQQLDGLFMGTVHWFWHFTSQKYPQLFPNGDFSLYVGTHNGKKYFDILLPETYCPKSGYNCIYNNPCISENCNQCQSGYYENCESIGRCWQWFEKHLILGLDPGYPSTGTRPIDAAPLLYGHSAFMFTSSFSDLHATRWYSEDVTRSCYGKGYNYKGSFIFNYKESKLHYTGRLGTLPGIECQPLPDNPQTGNIEESGYTVQRDIKYYPNPARHWITLEGMHEGDIWYIFNDQIAPLLSGEGQQIELDSLDPGFYFLIVTDKANNPVFRTRIQVQ
ncbi:MAG: hypothetical protein GX459_08370 [Bacteroidales bacterium]|nr:hypothetical protein [Bacteroidales bacterium]